MIGEDSNMLPKSRHPHLINIFVLLIVSLVILMTSTRPVSAHSRAEVGPYVIIVGWEHEPVIVGERNAVVVEVFEGDTPVEGLEGTLDAAINYAGRTFLANLEPTTEPGFYKIDILPTVRGQYELVLTGEITDLTVNEVLEPEEVLPAAVLEFPEEMPDIQMLQTNIDELNGRLQTAQFLAIGGLLLGLAGVGIGVFALLRRRS